MNFYPQGPSSLPSWELPLSFVEGLCTFFPSLPSQTEQDGADMGLRVALVLTCHRCGCLLGWH